MRNAGEYQFHPDLGLEAEIAGIGMADTTASAISDGLSENTGRELTTDEKVVIQDLMAPGFAHFYSLAEQAGELVGQGDVLGAFSLMGGVENARELLGEEAVAELFAGLGQDSTISPNDLE